MIIRVYCVGAETKSAQILSRTHLLFRLTSLYSGITLQRPKPSPWLEIAHSDPLSVGSVLSLDHAVASQMRNNKGVSHRKITVYAPVSFVSPRTEAPAIGRQFEWWLDDLPRTLRRQHVLKNYLHFDVGYWNGTVAGTALRARAPALLIEDPVVGD